MKENAPQFSPDPPEERHYLVEGESLGDTAYLGEVDYSSEDLYSEEMEDPKYWERTIGISK